MIKVALNGNSAVCILMIPSSSHVFQINKSSEESSYSLPVQLELFLFCEHMEMGTI